MLLTARAVFIIPSDMSVRANGIDELRPPDPYSKHGCSKSTADQYIIDYARTFGLLAVRFRMDWQHTVRGVNTVGLKRAGFDEKRIRAIREAFRILFRKGRNLGLAIKELEESGRANQDVSALLDFIKASKRGVCVGASESRS